MNEWYEENLEFYDSETLKTESAVWDGSYLYKLRKKINISQLPINNKPLEFI